MAHAGPSITITSLTNALAFAFGGLNSLTALRSFCVFASVCVVMLYLVVMTVFLCVVIWDTERVGRKKGECCGLFMCKQYSIFCCKGWFLSTKQIAYGSRKEAGTEPVLAPGQKKGDASLEASKTEKCLEKYLAPNLLTCGGRITLLAFYLLLIGVAAYGCTRVKIDFKVEYFIGTTAPVYAWF